MGNQFFYPHYFLGRKSLKIAKHSVFGGLKIVNQYSEPL